ncbi:MAG TPA: response regulator transcription factor, partial [Phytomonospora sp.]
MIRLVIVDDHPIVRGGLRDTFADADDIVVVGEAADGAEGVERAIGLSADVVLMDLRMPGTDGVAATAALRERAPGVHVLILTTFDGESDVLP